MEIILNGHKPKMRRMTCPNCGCIYDFDLKSDCEITNKIPNGGYSARERTTYVNNDGRYCIWSEIMASNLRIPAYITSWDEIIYTAICPCCGKQEDIKIVENETVETIEAGVKVHDDIAEAKEHGYEWKITGDGTKAKVVEYKRTRVRRKD